MRDGRHMEDGGEARADRERERAPSYVAAFPDGVGGDVAWSGACVGRNTLLCFYAAEERRLVVSGTRGGVSVEQKRGRCVKM